MRISVDFRFSAAHHLPNVVDGHPCRRVHGHNYRVRVTLRGPTDPRTGMVVDFHDIEVEFRGRVLARADHRDLNAFLSNPTAENIAAWIYGEMIRPFVLLEEVSVWEMDEYCATLRAGDST